ncbi:hypothetical protein [Hyphomicrobium sp. CS1GBMeth3]|uniref:hypothetical protein n=1 Tax=Hyphomicrobium sp. CS1GBMeth3 TaxID=1892845 RepID=UPI0009304072|nr:hypothetical protein [Hyphomicrobium sp. CS1GBMeth3]
MDNPDGTAEKSSATNVAPSDAPAASADVTATAEAFHLDLEAGPILADILSAGPAAESGFEDLHAALASLPNEGLGHADIALEHLTHAVDLFDVPTDSGTDGG